MPAGGNGTSHDSDAPRVWIVVWSSSVVVGALAGVALGFRVARRRGAAPLSARRWVVSTELVAAVDRWLEELAAGPLTAADLHCLERCRDDARLAAARFELVMPERARRRVRLWLLDVAAAHDAVTAGRVDVVTAGLEARALADRARSRRAEVVAVVRDQVGLAPRSTPVPTG